MSEQIKTSYGKVWVTNAVDMVIHRTDGPAVELDNGNVFFYINGNQVTFTDWLKLSNADSKTATFWRLKLANQI